MTTQTNSDNRDKVNLNYIMTQPKSERERGEQNFPDSVLSLCQDRIQPPSVRFINQILEALLYITISI